MPPLTAEQRDANRRAYEEREAIYAMARSSECNVCARQLVPVVQDGQLVARCADPAHQGYRALRSATQLVKDGDAVNPFISARIERRKQERLEEKMSNNNQSLAVVQRQQQGLITRDTAMQVVNALWPKAGPVAKSQAIMICMAHNLNPVDEEIFIVQYKQKDGSYRDKVILGIPGVRKIAREKSPYTYADGPRVMSADEQEAVLGEVLADQVVVTVTLQTPSGGRFPGYGFWPKAVAVQGADKGNTKFNMASYRAERNALKRIVPDDQLPAPVGMVVEGVYADGPTGQGTMSGEDETPVDYETGEILEGEAHDAGIDPDEVNIPEAQAFIERAKSAAGLSATDLHNWIVKTAEGKKLSTEGETVEIVLRFSRALFEDARAKIEARVEKAAAGQAQG